ncbi:MAG: gliding motility-associated C-terminal domain-containing protein [Bacteroidota bacterium]
MKIYSRFSYVKFQVLLLLFLLSFFSKNSLAQVQVGVTINDGVATTTCSDIFGDPDPYWEVKVGAGPWNTYSNNNSDPCYNMVPNLEWGFPFDCAEDVPASIQVCFQSLEADLIFGCNFSATCVEEICQNFAVPAPGNVVNYTLSLPANGDSGGTLEFSIGAIGTVFQSLNDEICNAENFGVIESGTTVGNASDGGFNNLCSTNTNEVSPATDGSWGNDQGVWFEFTTSATPGYEININALNDPLNLGNPMNIELAVYASDDGTCNGNLTLVESSFDGGSPDEALTLFCPEPNQTYFVLVDGLDFSGDLEGHFGIEISDNGVIAAPDTKCDAYDFGMVPIGGSVVVNNVHNECANNVGDPNPSAFISQRSVWFTFQAPPSGSVLVEAISVDGPPWNNGIGAQVGVYRSFNNSCTGFFLEVGSSFSGADNDESLELNCLVPGNNYWILVDGSGSNTAGIFDMVVTDLENYPPETVNDTTVCFGESVQVGNANYTTSGNYTYVFNLPNSCDSTVITNLTVADLLEVEAQQATLASSPTAANGAVTAIPSGGTAPFSYVWSNGAMTQLNENIPPGNYCVTVTDAIGCTAEGCVDLEFSLISASATGDSLGCFGATDGQLTFTAQDGTVPYTYNFSNTDGSITGTGIINFDGEIIEVSDLPAGEYQIDIQDADGNNTFAFAIIFQPTQIVTDQDYVLCFGESIVIGNSTYDASGNISETLTANNGCDSIVMGNVTILPDPSIIQHSTICFGESIVIGNSTYDASGSYVDTFVDVNGCDSIVTTNLTVLSEINITVAVSNLPSGYNFSNGTAVAQATGGGGGYTFDWSDGQDTPTAIDVTGGQEYCVTVTDVNGCSAQVCTTVLYEPNIALATNDTLDCHGDTDGEITLAVANGLGDYNFTWENTDNGDTGNGTITGNLGTALITNLARGDYSITVSDTYVTTTLAVAVIEPLPLEIQNIVAQNVTCSNACDGGVIINPVGGNAPYTYAWSGGIAPVADPTNLCPTDYFLTVTDANGCTATSLITVSPPPAFEVNISEMASIECGGDSNGALGATAVGGTGNNFTYAWSNSSNQASINSIGAGTYTVTATDEVGCTVAAAYTLTEPIPINFDLAITDVDCWSGLNSGSVVVENATGGTAPYVYAIGQNSFSTLPSFNQLVADIYPITIQDANGCQETQTATVGFPTEIDVDLGLDLEINLGQTIELEAITNSANTTIVWNTDSCQSCPILEVTPLNTTAYEVFVQDTITGCSDSDVIFVYVSKQRKIFIPNAFSPDGDGQNDFLTIFGDTRSISNIKNFRIFNRWGAEVFARQNMMPNEEMEGWNGFLNGKRMGSGVYIYFAEIEFIDGEVEVFRGDVTLMD